MNHLLNQLVLPDRYERLRDHLGSDVANLLVQPADRNIRDLRALADEIQTRREGVLVPLSGETGVGKTTFAMNTSQWVPQAFTQSLQYEGNLQFEELNEAVRRFSSGLAADNKKIIPINIDHRENSPPSDAELSVIKRFLRTNSANVPVIVFWPETDMSVANELARRYVGIAGNASVQLPMVCEGPSRGSWQGIAKHTLSLANNLRHLEDLGVNPEDYDPSAYRTLGSFLRAISQDFNRRVQQLRSQLERPVGVLIVFASESAEPGVLSQLTSASRYGLIDGHALISVTPQSVIGKWWKARTGLLTRTIVSLNAAVLCMPPSATSSVVRNFTESMPLFDEAGYRRYGRARGVRDLKRSDVGKFLIDANMSRFEARGTPGDEGFAAFQLMADEGFNLGKDKKLNVVMKDGLQALLEDENIEFEKITAEEKLPFCPLIPDNAVFFKDRVQCIEYTWRKGSYLASRKRSDVAQYILEKLRNYARELDWVED